MIQPATQWRVVAWFDNHDQAKAAATAVLSMMPRAYEFSGCTASGEAVWHERGEDYGAQSVRL